MEPRSPSKSKLPIMDFCGNRRVLKTSLTILVVLLLVSVGVYVIFKLGVAHYVSISSYFTVVVDCGSTGTRVHVYEWRMKDGVRSGNLPVLLHSYPDNSTKSLISKGDCQYHCMQTEPGLDKFVGNISKVRSSLEPLIVWAEKRVPSERHGDTPIFILATAGLRRLPTKDGRRVLQDVEAVVKEHEFKYKKSWIRVLSGKEEAYYGWVALNYQMGIFGNSSRLPTLGLLDLGGSSLQVVAETADSGEDEHVLRSRIGSLQHHILASSLPAFGLNEAFDRTVVMLSHSQALRESARGIFEISHPCLSYGFMQNYTCHGCFGVKSIYKENFSSHVNETELDSVCLAGHSDWEECKVLARAAAVNSSSSDWLQPKDDSNCTGLSLYGEHVLNLNAAVHSTARFHALSAFFAVYNMLNLSPLANLTKMWDEGQKLCSRSWTGLTRDHGKEKYAGQYCFRVSYLASLIEDALCLGDREIIFGPGNISWTLGAALLEGKYLWSSTTKANGGIFKLRNAGIILPSFFVFILLLCLLFIVHRSQIKLPMPGRKVTAVGASLPSYIYTKRRPV